jgi:hypothetical protein
MTATERKELIARYAAGYDEVVDALRSITPEELDWRPAPTEWSAREVVHHLADSETIAGVRLRRLLTEERPAIAGYDQDAYARQLRYAERPWEPALRAFEAARATTLQLLETMTEADWGRAGIHSESGPYSAGRFLQVYGSHAHDHANQIRLNRAAWARRAGGASRRP